MRTVVNLLGWLGTAAVAVSIVLRFQTVRIEWQQYSWHAAVTGLVLILLYMAAQWRDIAHSFRRRQTRMGAIAGASLLVVVGLLVAVNYLSSRRNYRWDLTAGGQFSLSDQTRTILQKLDAPVKVRVFAKPTEFDVYRDKLGEYEYISNRRLTVEYVNPDKQPVLATQNQVQSYGTVVFEHKDRTERVVSSDEQQLTNALIKVLSGEQRKVYFLQGHGEKDTTSSEREGYNAISQALGSDNYKVETVALAQKPEVPADAAVVVIAGPTTDLFPPEIDALKKYLDAGGKLLALVDPPSKAGAPPLTNLIAFLKEWGFEVGNDIIVDTSGVGQLLGASELTPVAVRYPSHPIVERFRVITAYPLARSVKAGSGAAGRSPQSFIESSPNSWAESDVAALFAQKEPQEIRLDEGKDQQGPISIGAAVSAAAANPPAAKPGPDGKTPSDAPKPETRVAVIGDSEFAANGYLGIQGNRDMFLNTVSWLAQQENLISIRPRDSEDRRVTLTADQQRLITWTSLLLIPAAVFGLGIYTWSRRRG